MDRRQLLHFTSLTLGAALLAMCDGQNQESELRFRLDANRSDVVRVAALKTGALLEAACRIGARLGGCTDQQVQALGVFGLVEMVVFIVTVFIAYAYVWRRGGLEWD